MYRLYILLFKFKQNSCTDYTEGAVVPISITCWLFGHWETVEHRIQCDWTYLRIDDMKDNTRSVHTFEFNHDCL